MNTIIPKNVIDDFLKSIEVTDMNKASIRQVLACAMNAEKVSSYILRWVYQAYLPQL